MTTLVRFILFHDKRTHSSVTIHCLKLIVVTLYVLH